MGDSDGEGRRLDLQDTMQPTPTEEEITTMTDYTDQEVDPAHSERDHCQSPTVASMGINDTILQSENATWSLVPSSEEQKRTTIEADMMDSEGPIPCCKRTTSRTRNMNKDFQISEHGNGEVLDPAPTMLNSGEKSATDHTASDGTVTHVAQIDTPINEDVGAKHGETQELTDHRDISGDSVLANDEVSRPLDEPIIADAIKIKTDDTETEGLRDVRGEHTVPGSTSHSLDTAEHTFTNAVTSDHGDADEIASSILEVTPFIHPSTKKVRFKEETPPCSPKPKQEVEPRVKSEHPDDTPLQDVAPKFDGNGCKPAPVKTRSRGPARTPREAVRREIIVHLRRRRLKKEKNQQKQSQKRKCDSSIGERGSKVPRTAEDDNAAVAVQLISAPGRDLSRVHGFDGHDRDHETAEDGNEHVCLDDDDELGKEDVLEYDEELEEANVLDFDLKRAVTSANIRSPKTIQKVFGHGRAIIHGADGLVITGMVSPLWKEQACAVHWMVNQEEIAIGPRGGILAAGMGTGKTVMSLGIIAGNPPLEEDLRTYSHATLVVVPNQKLAQQWKEKIAEHCTAAFTKESLIFDPKKGRMVPYLQMRNIV